MSAGGEPPAGAEGDRQAPAGAPGVPAITDAPPGPLVVARWVQLALLPIALLGLWVLARAAGKVLMMFIVAAIIALILNPLVAALQRSGVRRGLAVAAVYLGFFLAVAAVGYLLAHPIANQALRFSRDVPHIANEANRGIASFQGFLNRIGFHVHFVPQGKTALQALEGKVIKSLSRFAEFGGEVLREAAGAIFDVVVVFVLSVYMLLYGERIGALVRRLMPAGTEAPAGETGHGGRPRDLDDYPALVQRAVSRYMGGQLLFSLLMGATTGLGLYVFGLLGIFPPGKSFALAFGTFYGAMELIPYVGPFLGALPAVLLALFTHPISALWVALLFLALQQLEGHIVAPQIFGRTLRINPLLVIFALLFGLQVRGVIGALVALPLLSILRETVLYLRRHTILEPWSRAPGPLL